MRKFVTATKEETIRFISLIESNSAALAVMKAQFILSQATTDEDSRKFSLNFILYIMFLNLNPKIKFILLFHL